MLVEEVDAPLVYPFRDFLSYLMRSSAFNHVEGRPSVFRLGSGGGPDKERVSELSLQVILLDMIG